MLEEFSSLVSINGGHRIVTGDKHLVVATTYHNDKWQYKRVNLKVDILWVAHKRTQQGVST